MVKVMVSKRPGRVYDDDNCCMSRWLSLDRLSGFLPAHIHSYYTICSYRGGLVCQWRWKTMTRLFLCRGKHGGSRCCKEQPPFLRGVAPTFYDPSGNSRMTRRITRCWRCWIHWLFHYSINFTKTNEVIPCQQTRYPLSIFRRLRRV